METGSQTPNDDSLVEDDGDEEGDEGDEGEEGEGYTILSETAGDGDHEMTGMAPESKPVQFHVEAPTELQSASLSDAAGSDRPVTPSGLSTKFEGSPLKNVVLPSPTEPLPHGTDAAISFNALDTGSELTTTATEIALVQVGVADSGDGDIDMAECISSEAVTTPVTVSPVIEVDDTIQEGAFNSAVNTRTEETILANDPVVDPIPQESQEDVDMTNELIENVAMAPQVEGVDVQSPDDHRGAADVAAAVTDMDLHEMVQDETLPLSHSNTEAMQSTNPSSQVDTGLTLLDGMIHGDASIAGEQPVPIPATTDVTSSEMPDVAIESVEEVAPADVSLSEDPVVSDGGSSASIQTTLAAQALPEAGMSSGPERQLPEASSELILQAHNIRSKSPSPEIPPESREDQGMHGEDDAPRPEVVITDSALGPVELGAGDGAYTQLMLGAFQDEPVMKQPETSSSQAVAIQGTGQEVQQYQGQDHDDSVKEEKIHRTIGYNSEASEEKALEIELSQEIIHQDIEQPSEPLGKDSRDEFHENTVPGATSQELIPSDRTLQKSNSADVAVSNEGNSDESTAQINVAESQPLDAEATTGAASDLEGTTAAPAPVITTDDDMQNQESHSTFEATSESVITETAADQKVTEFASDPAEVIESEQS